MNTKTWTLVVLAALLLAPEVRAAELILPQNRNAFYSDEVIEVAVAGVERGGKAVLEFVPLLAAQGTLKVEVKGDGSTVAAALPAGALTPGSYTLKLQGKQVGKLAVRSGVNVSTMLLSQTVGNPRAAGGNFYLGNAFSFGLLDHEGRPLRGVRGRRSGGMDYFERAVADGMPTVVYMYWTGYVTHKPFGSEKSWANKDLVAATRLLNFHTAQRLRRYARNIHSVGTLDEPGLSWGRTPAGGLASGFPNWDERPWYKARGWDLTDDPGSRPDDDWMKYMKTRCAIIKEVDGRAKKDLRAVWPGVVFSTDLYAPQAIMDGTDPLNQQVNDIPSSHVFLDWGVGRLGALSGVYLEKAHDPTAKLAHAMNGQLFGERVPQPAQRDTYHLMRNALLAAGLSSNWWLNPTGMTEADLAAVNEPGLRLGPLFKEMAPAGHDVAVLWSFTEIAMREKDVLRREARKKTGEQIKLMIAALPETANVKGKEVVVNAYNVGGNYKEQVLGAHQALARAGFPAHILHERLLPAGALKKYKTLVVVGQTFELPGDVRKAIADFVAAGGKVVEDETCKVKFGGAVQTAADWRDPGFRWAVLYARAERKDHGFKNERAASYYLTNYFMDQLVRKAVGPTRAAMRKTDSRPALVTDSVHLAAEKHTGGEGALYMVLNGYEKLPDIPRDRKYYLYNYAPYTATYTLEGIKPGSAVYCIAGVDWGKVTKVEDFSAPQKETFAPGEMKLYLVAPRRPGGLDVKAEFKDHALTVSAGLRGLKMPWPLTVAVTGPDGKDLYRVYRATDTGGSYRETFPVGANAAAGLYEVHVASPVAGLAAAAKVEVKPGGVRPVPLTEAVRVFDGPAMARFLAGKPELVIALGNGRQKAVADKLAGQLKAHGIKASVRPEAEVIRKARYPRVWNPYAVVYAATGPEKKPKQAVKVEIEVGVSAGGKFTARTAAGKDVSGDWRQPNSLVTFVGRGLVDYSGDREVCFEPGVKLYYDAGRQMSVVRGEVEDVRTTEEFKARWARPWDRLTQHVGAYQLPPELPEAYTTDSHLILLGDSDSGEAVAALQASEVLPQVADAGYPGKGKALLSLAWSPFAVEKNVILVGASDEAGLAAGVARLVELAGQK